MKTLPPNIDLHEYAPPRLENLPSPEKVIVIKRKTRGQIVAEEVRELLPLLLIAGLALFLTWIGLRAGFGTPVTIEEIGGWL